MLRGYSHLHRTSACLEGIDLCRFSCMPSAAPASDQMCRAKPRRTTSSSATTRPSLSTTLRLQSLSNMVMIKDSQVPHSHSAVHQTSVQLIQLTLLSCCASRQPGKRGTKVLPEGRRFWAVSPPFPPPGRCAPQPHSTIFDSVCAASFVLCVSSV